MDDLRLALRIRAAVEGQDAIVRLGTSFLDTNKKIETLIRGLTAITGSTEGAAKEFEYLAESSKKYGISILDMSDNYVKFIAASKETNLEGEAAKKIFESVSSAMAELGGDTITTHRAFNALSQMMSKTQIYAEELKGQLAEAIPGSLQLMAKALNITTSEMLELMKAGQLSADALLPFAYELDKQYGKLATSSTTFVQATNQIQTAWALLIKRLGDTGVWSVLTSSLDALGNNSFALAGILGSGLTLAFIKLGKGITTAVSGIKEYVVATRLGATASQNSAVSALANAEAKAQAALSERIYANQQLVSATATELATRGTVAHSIAVKELQLATAQAAIANKVYAASTASVGVAQNAVVASTRLLSKAWSLITGPAGLFVAAIAGFAAMAFAFREQDDATKNLSKSTEEYVAALDKMTAAQLANQNSTTKKSIEQIKDEIQSYNERIAVLNKSIEQSKGMASVTDQSYFSRQELSAVTEKLGKAEELLLITEGKLSAGLNSLGSKYNETKSSIESQSIESDKLKQAYQEQLDVVNKLKQKRSEYVGVSQESNKTNVELAIAIGKLNALEKEQLSSNARLLTEKNNLTNIVGAYAKQTGLSTEEVKKAIAGDTDFISSLDKKKQATVNAIQRQRELSALERESQVQLRLLKAEYDNIEGSVKAQTEAKIKEATVLGDLEKKRAAEIDQGRQLIQLAELGIKTSKEEINNISLQIAQKQEEAKTNDKERVNIEKNIAKLEEQRLGLQKTLNQREANITAVRAEAIATEIANSLISDSFTKNQQIIANAANEIARLRQEYNELNQTSAGTELLRSQEEITQRIIEQQNKASDAAKVMGESMRSVYATLGIDWKEVITGMDFDTQRMIDAFGLLGESGLTTAQQIQTSFEGVLSKANTETEINAIRVQLQKLKDDGVISFEQLGLMTVDVQKKLTDLKVSIDPVQQAFARLGLGVHEQLTQVAEGLRVSFNLLKSINAPIESVQQAFLNMAQAQITASLATGQAIPATLQLEAASLGLSSAFQELVRSLQSSNQEFNAVIAQYERLQQIQDKNNELKQKEIELGDEWNTVTLKRSQNLGDEAEILASLVKADQLRVEAIQQEIAISEKKVLTHTLEIKQLEAIEAAGRKLSEEDKNKLELMKLQLALDQQLVLSGKAKQAQIESEIVSYQNSINKIQERLKQYLLEASLRNEANASQQKTIEIEKQLELSKGNLTAAREKDLGIAKEELDIAKEKFQEDAKKLNAINDEIIALEKKYNSEGRNNQELLKTIETLKLRRVAEIAGTQASEADIKVKERQVELARIAAGPIGALIQLYNEQAKAQERSSASSGRYQDSLVKEAEGALNIAKIRGNSVDIAKSEEKVTESRINQAETLANARSKEAEIAEKSLSAKITEMAVDKEWTQTDQEAENQLRETVDTKKDAANSAQQNATQIKKEAEETKKSTEEQKKAGKGMNDVAAAAQHMANNVKTARDEVGKLSEASKLYFDQKLLKAGFEGGAISAYDFQKGIRVVSTAMDTTRTEKFQAEINSAVNSMKAARKEMQFAANGFGVYEAALKFAAAETSKEFYSQKLSVENLRNSIEAMSKNGAISLTFLDNATRQVDQSFNLLNEQDLSELRGSISKARGEMESMKDAVQEAKDALIELNAELASEKGDTATSDRLNLQLEQQQKISDIETKLKDARKQNNQELISLYQSQLDKTKELYVVKEKNLEKDIQASEQEKASAQQTNKLSDQEKTLAQQTNGVLDNQNDIITKQQAIIDQTSQSVNSTKTEWENVGKAISDARAKLDTLNEGTQYNSDLLKANNDLTDQLSQLQIDYRKDVKKSNEGLSSDLLSIQEGYTKDTLKADQSLKNDLISSQKSYEKSIRSANKALTQNLADDQDTLNSNLLKNKKSLADDLAKSQETYSESLISSKEKLNEQLANLDSDLAKSILKANADSESKVQDLVEKTSEKIVDANTKHSESIAELGSSDSQKIQESLAKTADSIQSEVSNHNQAIVDLQQSATDSIAQVNADAAQKISELNKKSKEESKTALESLKETALGISKQLSGKKNDAGSVESDAFQKDTQKIIELYATAGKEGKSVYDKAIKDAEKLHRQNIEQLVQEGKLDAQGKQNALASITQQIAANKALLKLETDKVAAKKAEQQALITEESKAKILGIQQETDKKIADAILVSRDKILHLEEESKKSLDNIQIEHQAKLDAIDKEHDKVVANAESDHSKALLKNSEALTDKISQLKIKQNEDILDAQKKSDKESADSDAKLAKDIANAKKKNDEDIANSKSKYEEDISNSKKKNDEAIANAKEKNAEDIASAKEKNEADLLASKVKLEADIVGAKQKHDQDIQNLRIKNEEEILAEKEKTDKQISIIKEKYDAEIKSLQEVIASATLSYTEQNNKLLELNATLKNQLDILTAIKQVAATTENAKSSSTSSSSSVSSSRNQTEWSKGVYNVNFTIGGKTLNTQWNTDPTDFITALERAQKTGL